MTDWDKDRMISASELERWCYCPLSWKLERDGTGQDNEALSEGIRKHRDIGKEAVEVMRSQKGQKESRSITIVYLIFSFLLLLMGVSLVVLTKVGTESLEVWRIGVVLTSVVLLLVSLSIYFLACPLSKPRGKGELKGLIKGMDEKKVGGRSTTILFYLYGLFLLVNGIVLLRPFGIDDRIISSIMTVSLAVLYLFLLTAVTINFRRNMSMGSKKDIPMGAPLIIGLVVSLSILFIFISDIVDKDGMFGWVFLTLALLWFIGALFYDFFLRLRRDGTRTSEQEGSGLHIASMALMASVFTASTFLAKGDNLDQYYLMSIAVAAMWLIGAVFFFWRGSTHRRTAMDKKRKLNLPESSDLVQADELKDKRGKPMVSKKHFLIGIPDMIIEENGQKVPVEVKTGRIPIKPHFSHVMQLSAYLVLMDSVHDQSTSHGYLEYAPSEKERKRFKIEWDMMTKALVLSKVSEIREAERTKVVHRNHNREGKCRNCSRREGCPEKLA